MASSCVLRATGDEFQTAEFLRESIFQPVNVFCKGECKSVSRTWDTSGITVVVSDADAFKVQVDDAIAFIENNREELCRLNEFAGVEGCGLDFGIYPNESVIQTYVFPSKLIRLADDTKLELELSIYGVN